MKTIYKIKIYQPIRFGIISPFSLDKIDRTTLDNYFDCKVNTIATFKYDNVPSLLEYLFYHFNFAKKHKNRFKLNHSLSVGDIVEVNNIKYIVMPVGWKELKI